MNESPTILIIVGITGDLAKRKLLPVIGSIAEQNALPDEFRILGITRQANISANELLASIKNGGRLKSCLELFSMDVQNESDYPKLFEYLITLEKRLHLNASPKIIWYLAVPPIAVQKIVQLLGTSGVAKNFETKIMFEKPFGTDFVNARMLIDDIDSHFYASQVCRVDHFLAKGLVQEFVAFRNEEMSLKGKWNAGHIKRIEIMAGEFIGIESRTQFYEHTGALRDIIQSHLLLLAATVLSPDDRLAALRKLLIPSQVFRGQYKGYREEVGNPNSTRETFARLTLFSTDPEWEGVPVILTTGKMLDKKTTEIRIAFKDRDDLVFAANGQGTYAADGYERVFAKAFVDDSSLCVSKEEVIETWRIVEGIENDWQQSFNDLVTYEPGAVPESIIAI